MRSGRGLGGLAVLLAGSVASLSGLQAQKKTPPPAIFLDATAKSGITFVHASGATPEKYMVETFGSGVAWIDIDNDGFVDLYFVTGAPGASNALYRKQWRRHVHRHYTAIGDRCRRQSRVQNGRRRRGP